MSIGMNSVNVTGRIGKEPELRRTASGKAVCSFSLALDEGKDQDPTWVDVTAWEKTAELVDEYLDKGDECGVTGRLRQERWEAENGEKRSRLVVVANQVVFLRKKGEGASHSQNAPTPQQAPAPDEYGPINENEDPFA